MSHGSVMPLVLISPLVFMWTKMEYLCWTADRSICSMTATGMKKSTIMRSMQTILAVTTGVIPIPSGSTARLTKPFTSFKERISFVLTETGLLRKLPVVSETAWESVERMIISGLPRKELGRPPRPFSKLSAAKNTASQVKTFPHLFVSFPGALIIQPAEC